MNKINIDKLHDKEILLNREFGLIQFQHRVLAKAIDEKVPLLERLSYLCIVIKNCDELFEVRIARLLKWSKENSERVLPDGSTATEALDLARKSASKLCDEIYKVYHNILTPKLREAKIFILNSNEWNGSQKTWVYNHFINELKPVLTPIGIDPAHPFPRVPNKNLHFAVELSGKDQFGRNSKIAIVEAPRILPRVIQLPTDITTHKDTFILLQDIIKIHVKEFFPGLSVKGCYPFKVTRAADIILKENAKNLRSAVTKELKNRQYAECSRLELDISGGTPDDKFVDILLKQFSLTPHDLYLANGPVNLSRLADVAHMITRSDLHFSTYNPGLPAALIRQPDIFKAMKKQDILIHTPYQSFDPILELTRLAAEDPTVLAVKMTLYRTGIDSEVTQNLIKAALAGKQVVVSVELFARFDEEANLEITNQLENAGAHVVYGVMGYKVHAKMLLIVRKEDDQLRHYIHLGTGNYHPSTAKVYTDFGLLTTNHKIAMDVNNIFAQITGVGRTDELNLICQSPFNFHETMIKAIETEIVNIINGEHAEIVLKMNSLLEPEIIKTLYRASQAGVKITLLIRGACALRPGIKGLSDNIQVKSIVGRFLEHHRIFYFFNNGKENLYISSADWMNRNFFRRVETCVTIIDPKIKTRIIEEGLRVYMRDNIESWIMDQDGYYSRFIGRGKRTCAQERLMKKLADKSDSEYYPIKPIKIKHK